MESLMKNSKGSKWIANSIEEYRQDLNLEDDVVKNNICYNFQYLEYINLQLKSLKLTSVLRNLVFKTGFITSFSILEGVLSSLLKASGKWEQNKKGSDKQYKIGDLLKVIENENICEISEFQKTTILMLNNQRNKVHLMKPIKKGESDYNSPYFYYYYHLNKLLYDIMEINKIFKNADIYNFLLDRTI